MLINLLRSMHELVEETYSIGNVGVSDCHIYELANKPMIILCIYKWRKSRISKVRLTIDGRHLRFVAKESNILK